MRFNELNTFLNLSPYHHEVVCPYCEAHTGESESDTITCNECNQKFIMEGDIACEIDDIHERFGLNISPRFLNEAVDKVAEGKQGWKTVVSSFHDQSNVESYSIFWSIKGSNVLFKDISKVDLNIAMKEITMHDPDNETEFNYDPNMERVDTLMDMKSIIDKYNLDMAGYSVSSFVISLDGTKVYTGAPLDVFGTGEELPFLNSISRCIQLKNELRGAYQADDDTDDEFLQVAINNFIGDNPLILSLPTDSRAPEEVGYFSELMGSNETDDNIS